MIKYKKFNLKKRYSGNWIKLNNFISKVEVSRQIAYEINKKYYETCINNLNSYEYLKWLNDIYPNRIDKTYL